jgi:hypothetical protein
MTRAARAAYFAAAPAASLLLFWRVLSTWFLGDDFAWLGKPLEVHNWGDLPQALFAPEAQGTVRVLSERVFFLIFAPLFGLHALPYRIVVLATWFADLALATAIGARLTQSRAAGFFAGLLWAVSVNVTYSLDRISAYNQVLCSFFILFAFYARLRSIESNQRKWRIAEWIAYLAGFGALEIVVMYPAIAALHAIVFVRKKILATLPLFIPAAIFAAVHYFLIPKPSSTIYAVIVDHRLPETFLRYFSLALGPIDLGNFVRHAHRPAVVGVWLIGIALLVFSIARMRRGNFAPIFFAGWFLLLIAPVLPVPNHISSYYLTLPQLGFAWLGGWAIATALSSGAAPRAIAIFLAAAYFTGSALAVNGATRFTYNLSLPVRTLILSLQDAARAHPDSEFFLAGIEDDLFHLGVQDDPFRLLGLKQVYLIPGGEDRIHARADLGGIARWVSTPQSVLHAIENGRGRVYQFAGNSLFDITAGYRTILLADPRATRLDFVDAADPAFAAQLGPTWYKAEQGLRWMPKSATLRVSGPASASAKFYVTGYVPPAIVADGPVTLTFRAAGEKIGDGKLSSDGNFSFEFPLPASLAGQHEIEIAIEASRVLHPASDPRDFGAAFGTFSIR